MMPMITVELRTYTTAARPRPIIVASGMLRFGFSMTPADTAALSMPMYAHSTIEAAREIACQSDWPLTFQLAWKISGLNQNQPMAAMATMGISASAMVQASSRPTMRGPLMLTTVSSQMTSAVTMVLAGGPSMFGTSSAR